MIAYDLKATQSSTVGFVLNNSIIRIYNEFEKKKITQNFNLVPETVKILLFNKSNFTSRYFIILRSKAST